MDGLRKRSTSRKRVASKLARRRRLYALERLEPRILFAWIGATSGNTIDASHDYNDPANWSGGVINDDLSATTLTANTTIYFSADHATAGGLNLGYSGNYDLTFMSTSATPRTLTLNGALGGDFGGAANNRTVTLGDATNVLNLALGGATRTLTTATGDTAAVLNVVSTGGLTKAGAGTLTLTGANTYAAGTTLAAGQLNVNHATAIGTGTFAINGGTIDNTSGSAITLSNNNAQVWGGNFTFTGTNALNLGTGAVTVSDELVSYQADATSGASLIDSTANARTASLSGSYALATGVNGNALQLAGGYASLPSGIVSGLNDFSVAAWVNPDVARGWARIFDFGTSNTNYMFLTAYAASTGHLRFGITTSGLGGEQVLDGGTLSTNTWSHVAVTLSGNVGTLYINGVAVATNAGMTLHPTTLGTTTNNYLGKSQFAADPAFTGNIDDFRIYGRALSTTELAQLAAAGVSRTVTVGASTLTVGGVISGGTGVTKAGAGTLTLSGANTFGGGTTLSAGTLNVNNATALGTGTFTINGGTIDNTSGGSITLSTNNAQTWGANVTFTGTNALNLGTGAVSLGANRQVTTAASTLTVGGITSGAYSLTKAGAGALTLAGANTYSGGTTLSAGTLNVNAAAALGTGAFTVGAGTTINNTSGGAITLSTNNVQSWSGDFTFTGTNALNLGTGAVTLSAARTVTTAASTLTVGGAIGGAFGITKAGAGTLAIGGASTYSGGTTVDAGTLQAYNAAGGTSGITPTMLGTTSSTVTVNAGATLWLSYLLGSSSNTVTYANHVSGAGTVRVTAPGSNSASTAVLAGNYGSFTGVLDLFPNSGSAGKTAFSNNGYGTPPAASATIKVQSGTTLYMTTGQTYASAIQLYGMGNAENLGTLRIESSTTASGAVTLMANASVGSNVGSGTISGVIGDGGAGYSLTKRANSTITLSGANTYSGGTWVTSGQLQVNDNLALGTGTVTLNGGALQDAGVVRTLTNAIVAATGTTSYVASNSSDLKLNGNLSGSGNIQKGGSNSVFFGGSNSGYTGTFTVQLSNVYFSATTAGSANATWVLNGSGGYGITTTGTVQLGSLSGTGGGLWGDNSVTAATFQVGALGTNTTFSGTISNSQAVVAIEKVGAGTFTLSGNNTHTGGTTVSAGRLNVNSATAVGSGRLTIAAGATIDNASGAAITLTNNNAQTWNGSFTFTGSNALNLGTGAVTLGAASTLTTTASTLTVGGAVGDGGSGYGLTKAGAGTLALGGASTFGGGVGASGGTLLVSNSTGSATGSGAVAIAGGATLAGSGSIGGAVTVSSGGALSPGNGGTGILSTGALTLAAGATLASELNTNTAGTGYDQVNVTGAADVSGATLTLSGARTAHDGTVLSLVQTTAPVVGAFSGLAQAGTRTLNGVSYSANYAASSGNTFALTANLGPTAVALGSSDTTTVFGEPVTFTATVTSGSSGTITGTVTFYDGATSLGSGTISAGVATRTTSAVGTGTRSITAVYNGDSDFATSTSSALSQTVGAAGTTTAVTSSANPAPYGQSLTLTATVSATTPSTATPTGGTVTFYNGATSLGSATLSAGVATINLSSLTIGSHSITAVYAGAADFTGSTSSALSQSVAQTMASIAVSPSSTSLNHNATRQFSAVAYDAYAQAMVTQPTFTWSVDGGAVGTVDSTGLYDAGATAGSATVRATSGATSGTATVTASNGAPTVATPAAAAPSPATGTTTALSVLGADDNGQPSLTYTWSATTKPVGSSPSFSANGTNAAKAATVTFDRAGSYTFQVTILDGEGLSVTSSVSVTVNQTLTTVGVTPASTALNENQTVQLAAVGYDQFGAAMASQPTITWSIDGSGVGSVDSTGLYNAGATPGSATVRATSGATSGTAAVTVANAAPTVATLAAATPSTVTGTTTALSVLGADDGTEPTLTYAWVATSKPLGSTPSFSANATNAAKSSTVTFDRAGAYTFQVTILDHDGVTVTSDVAVTVNQTLTSVTVAPASTSLNENQTVQLAGTAYDQFGLAMTSPPTLTWSVDGAGVGSVNSAGLYNAGATPGSATVRATSGATSGAATVTVTNAAPTTATPAAATPSPVSGTTTALSVVGADDGGEPTLTYAWAATSTPAGSSPAFGANATNAAKNTTVTFDRAGSYTFRATILDHDGVTVTSDVAVTVNQTLTSVTVAPASTSLNENQTVQLAGTACDQFGQAMASQPTFAWSVDGGGVGTVDSAGAYAVGTTQGTATVRATVGGVSGTATVTISSAAPTVATPAAATPASVTGTTTLLTVLGADDGGESLLTYAWSATSTPAGSSPTFIAGGTNGAKDTAVTFDRAGAYTFQATIEDQHGQTVTSTVTFTVDQTLTSVVVTPALTMLDENQSVQLGAVAYDQFGRVMAAQPAVTWSVASGVGSISAGGLYGSGATPGTATVAAECAGGVIGNATVTVANTAPTIVTAAQAGAAVVTGAGIDLHVAATDDGGESLLSYTWSLVTAPAAAGATFDVNGDNLAKDATVTFDVAGDYVFRVAVGDGTNVVTGADVHVTVSQSPTVLNLLPGAVDVLDGEGVSLTATPLDQFGAPMTAPPTLVWSVDAGARGTISSGGAYLAPVNEAATDVVRVTAPSAGLSATSLITVSVAPPAAPSGVSVSAPAPDRVVVRWADDAANEDGFQVERTTGAMADWIVVGRTAANATSFSDTTVVGGNRYAYRVEAFRGATVATGPAFSPATAIVETVALSWPAPTPAPTLPAAPPVTIDSIGDGSGGGYIAPNGNANDGFFAPTPDVGGGGGGTTETGSFTSPISHGSTAGGGGTSPASDSAAGGSSAVVVAEAPTEQSGGGGEPAAPAAPVAPPAPVAPVAPAAPSVDDAGANGDAVTPIVSTADGAGADPPLAPAVNVVTTLVAPIPVVVPAGTFNSRPGAAAPVELLTPEAARITLQAYQQLATDPAATAQVKASEEQRQSEQRAERIVTGTAAAATATVAAGYVVWLVQGSSLLVSLVTQMPFWRWFDPLPVLDSWDRGATKISGATTGKAARGRWRFGRKGATVVGDDEDGIKALVD